MDETYKFFINMSTKKSLIINIVCVGIFGISFTLFFLNEYNLIKLDFLNKWRVGLQTRQIQKTIEEANKNVIENSQIIVQISIPNDEGQMITQTISLSQALNTIIINQGLTYKALKNAGLIQ